MTAADWHGIQGADGHERVIELLQLHGFSPNNVKSVESWPSGMTVVTYECDSDGRISTVDHVIRGE